MTFEIHVLVIAEKLFLPVKFGFTYSCIYNYNNILHYLLFLFLARANSFSFSPYYANHMVLQRGSKGASIWGHSTVHGDKVQLYVNNVHSGSATVDSHGIWQGKVTDPATNKAVVITASSSVGNVTLHDVLFGDVWLCSGQSNMEFNVNGVN